MSRRSRFMAMLTLVLAGETIFFLPFVLPRVFRPTMLDVFDVTNFELGSMFSAYGVIAMISYFLGGPLADRFAARGLMALALITTAIGGFFMVFIPSVPFMTLIYGYWGLTTILLFWAALIRATREWGTPQSQGSAFGLLDGGRGFAGALISTAGVTLMSRMLPERVRTASLELRIESFQYVILGFAVFTLLVGIMVWFTLPPGKIKGKHDFATDLKGLKAVLRNRVVWIHSIILLCGYVGYKITDDFSLYAQDVLGLDEVKAAGVGTLSQWLRPLAAIVAGILADRFRSSRLILFCFTLLLLGSLAAGTGILRTGALWPYVVMFLSVGAAVYALRVLYYSVMEEAGYPLAITGTVVGIISVVGYTPDIFVGPLMGWLLDRSPGPEGHRHVFLMLAGFSLVGLIASLLFRGTVTGKGRS